MGEIFNIATGTATSVNQLARTFMRIVGKARTEPLHSEPKPGEIKHSCASIEKARKVLGYKPILAVDNGLRQLVKWYASEPCKSSQGKKCPSR